MKIYWIKRFLKVFKRKDYMSGVNYNDIGLNQSSLIEIAKNVIEEENKTKEIDSKLKDKLDSLEVKELI